MTAAPIAAWAQPVTHGVQPSRISLPHNVIVAGCHGGAGVTTLVRLLNPTFRALDAGQRIAQPGKTPLIAVARGNVGGASRATEWLNSASAGGIVPHVLVVVADASFPEPKVAKLRFHLLHDRLRHGVVRFPYVERWRYCEDDDIQALLPRSARRALEELHQFVARLVQT